MLGDELIGETIIGTSDDYEIAGPDASVYFSLGGYDLNGHVVLPISISGLTRSISTMNIPTRAKSRLSENGMDPLKYSFQLIFSSKIEADAFRRLVNGLSEDVPWCGGRSDWYQISKYVSVSPAEIIDDLIHYLYNVTLEFENPMLIKLVPITFILTKASLPLQSSGFVNDGTADASLSFRFDARYANGQHLKGLNIILLDGTSMVSSVLLSDRLLSMECIKFSEGDTIVTTYLENFIDPAKLLLDIYKSDGLTIYDGYIHIASGGRLTYKFFGPNPTLDNIFLQADFLVTAGLPYVQISTDNVVSPWGEADINNIGTKPITVAGTYTQDESVQRKYEVKLGQGTPDTYSYRFYDDEVWSDWSTPEPIFSGGFKLGLDTGTPVQVTFAYEALATGATIAAAIQSAIQALAGDYAAMTCTFGASKYTITFVLKGGFNLKVGTDSVKLVWFSYETLTSGATIAAAIQEAIRALGGNCAAMTCGFANGNYTITHANMAVVVTDASSNNLAAVLKLGVANGGTESGHTSVSNGGVTTLAVSKTPHITDSIRNNLAAVLKLGVANGGTESGHTSVSNGGVTTLAVQVFESADRYHIYSHALTNWKTGIAASIIQNGYQEYYLDETDKVGDIYISFYCPPDAGLDINFLRFESIRTIVPVIEFMIPAGKNYSVLIEDAANSSHEVDTDISFSSRSWP